MVKGTLIYLPGGVKIEAARAARCGTPEKKAKEVPGVPAPSALYSTPNATGGARRYSHKAGHGKACTRLPRPVREPRAYKFNYEEYDDWDPDPSVKLSKKDADRYFRGHAAFMDRGSVPPVNPRHVMAGKINKRSGDTSNNTLVTGRFYKK